MHYAVLIYEDESTYATVSEHDGEQMHKEYAEYTQLLIDAGVMRGGEHLQPVSSATSIRGGAAGAEQLVTDGPFAETREQLGGFYIIDCADLDAALHWAKLCPAARTGTVEVRPVVANN